MQMDISSIRERLDKIDALVGSLISGQEGEGGWKRLKK